MDFSREATGGLTRILRVFRDRSANVNTQGGQYGTALHTAVSRGQIDVVRLLLDQGADVNAYSGVRYRTALHTAATRGHQDIVQELLQSSADFKARGEDGITALQAVLGTNVATVRRVFDNGDDYTTTQYTARLEQFSGIVQLLLDKGADFDTQGGEYSTVPQVAIEKEQVLFKRGTDIDVQGGQFALQAAAFRGHVEIVRLLLDQGTEVNAQGGQSGGTALWAAASRGHTEIVQLLLDHGADINA
ncbi:Ankyrin repeat domain-containing protein 50 [Penicillium rolfsii]|nr:Ankyrin repeat domain-containing protein 50 [Penicillium rolfsii]